ncbi:MAG: aminodeoxychorismate lyase [Pseudomonadota bacterium]|jgi:4-amino-4-deoxychorismate lyase
MLSVPIDDRGLTYGDGVWETIAVKAGTPLLLDEHLERLAWGARTLQLQGLNLGTLKQQVLKKCQSTSIERAVLKLIITRGSGQRGYNPVGLNTPRIVIQINPAPIYPSTYYDQGIVVGLCKTRLAYQPLLAGFKHLNRLEQVLARAEFESTWQEGLVLDYAGQVIEGTMSNVFIYTHDQVLITPDLSGCGIAGIMRAQVLKMAQGLGIPCRIQPLLVQDVLNAHSVLMTNSLIGLWPVREFNQQHYVIADSIHTLQQQLKPYFL